MIYEIYLVQFASIANNGRPAGRRYAVEYFHCQTYRRSPVKQKAE
jgi:hypothetical protein